MLILLITVIYKYVSKLAIIGSDNGLLPVQLQAISWTNESIEPLGTNFSEINAFEMVLCQILAILSRPQCVKICVLCSIRKVYPYDIILV